MTTIFGKILRGELPCDSVYEDEQCMAFRDINACAPSHILVIPRREISRLDAMTEPDEPLVGHLMRVATLVAKKEGLEDFRVVINNGAGAGQSVFHLHAHVLGGRSMGWPPG